MFGVVPVALFALLAVPRLIQQHVVAADGNAKGRHQSTGEDRLPRSVYAHATHRAIGDSDVAASGVRPVKDSTRRIDGEALRPVHIRDDTGGAYSMTQRNAGAINTDNALA